MGGDAGPAPRRSAEQLAAIPWQADAAVFAGCSFLSASAVVPVVMAVDKSVTQAAAGMSLSQALKVVLRDFTLRPHRVVCSIPYGIVMGVYFLTYGANNLADVVSERYDLGSSTQNAMKLFGATGAYTTSSILKDVAGGIKSSSSMDPQTADKVAQLATPCGMQILITPIHLFGLNLYNQPKATANERMRAVMKTYPEATGVRMFRFLWAYGVGGLINKELNQRARDWTVARYASQSASQPL